MQNVYLKETIQLEETASQRDFTVVVFRSDRSPISSFENFAANIHTLQLF